MNEFSLEDRVRALEARDEARSGAVARLLRRLSGLRAHGVESGDTPQPRTATTTPDGLPYPTDYAEPADVPKAMQDLAEATQAGLVARLPLTGGVLSGDLSIAKTTPRLILDSATPDDPAIVYWPEQDRMIWSNPADGNLGSATGGSPPAPFWVGAPAASNPQHAARYADGIPRFATSAERDAFYGALPGGPQNGMECRVGANRHMYALGGWQNAGFLGSCERVTNFTVTAGVEMPIPGGWEIWSGWGGASGLTIPTSTIAKEWRAELYLVLTPTYPPPWMVMGMTINGVKFLGREHAWNDSGDGYARYTILGTNTESGLISMWIGSGSDVTIDYAAIIVRLLG